MNVGELEKVIMRCLPNNNNFIFLVKIIVITVKCVGRKIFMGEPTDKRPKNSKKD